MIKDQLRVGSANALSRHIMSPSHYYSPLPCSPEIALFCLLIIFLGTGHLAISVVLLYRGAFAIEPPPLEYAAPNPHMQGHVCSRKRTSQTQTKEKMLRT